MAPKCLPLELLFEIVPFIPAENAAPNAISSCLLLHNLLLPRVIKWKETKKMCDSIQKLIEELRSEMNTRMDGFEARMKNLEGEVKNLGGEVKNLDGEVKSLKVEVKNLGGEVKNLDGEVKSLKVEVNALKFAQPHFLPPPMSLQSGRYMDFEIGSSAAFDVRNNTSSEMQHPSLAYSTVSTPFRRNLAKTANPVQILSPINPFSGISFGYSVPSMTSPSTEEKVSLSTAIRQGRLDNPSVDSAIKSNFEKSKKAHFYIHADTLNSLLCKFASKVRNKSIDKTTLTMAISEFEAQFTHTLEEIKSVLNVLHSSIDAEEAAKLKQIVQTLSKWALHIHEKAENVSKVSTIGNLFTPLSGGLQNLVSESRGQLPRGTDANAQQRALQRQTAKPNVEFDVDFGHDLSTQNVVALLKGQRSALADPPMQLIPHHFSEVSLSIAIRQGRLDNPGVDSAIKSNCEKSDKALFYEHAESLQSLLHDFPRKLRNECTDRTLINIAIYDFEARFMSTLDEMNSVMNALRSSIDAE
ncbi:hypothetical protein niasHS_010414 [Heterodera schachtii]|uniref:Uncharacterized protein n=1 Tax=Heterodera schachtii TaxID=97005 RepID=A0ABD2J4N8_HETSC